jgi:hypothetical protein
MSILKGAISGATTWIGKTIGGAIGGPTGAKVGSMIGSKVGEKVGGLFEKKSGADQDWEPVSTAVTPPSYSGYSLSTYKAGKGQGPDVRMKTVDAETLNAEWEYRLTKGLRNRNLFT